MCTRTRARIWLRFAVMSDRTEGALTIGLLVLAVLLFIGGVAGQRWMLWVGAPIIPGLIAFAAFQESRD